MVNAACGLWDDDKGKLEEVLKIRGVYAKVLLLQVPEISKELVRENVHPIVNKIPAAVKHYGCLGF